MRLGTKNIGNCKPSYADLESYHSWHISCGWFLVRFTVYLNPRTGVLEFECKAEQWTYTNIEKHLKCVRGCMGARVWECRCACMRVCVCMYESVHAWECACMRVPVAVSVRVCKWRCTPSLLEKSTIRDYVQNYLITFGFIISQRKQLWQLKREYGLMINNGLFKYRRWCYKYFLFKTTKDFHLGKHN